MITLAIHTYERALALRARLESEGIPVELTNVVHDSEEFTSGVRVRIPEDQLPLALRIVEGDDKEEGGGKSSRGGGRRTKKTSYPKAILVPVDFSEHSYMAVAVAAGIAAQHKVGLKLLHSYIDPYIAGNVQFTDTLSYDPSDNGARKMMEDASRRLMHNFLVRLHRGMRDGFIPKVKLESVVVEGVPEDAIVEYARMEMPQLLVMGTRCAEQKNSEIIGSVTAEVLDEGRFTVLTVPDVAATRDAVLNPEKILFVCNLDQNDIIALDTLYRLYPSLHATVILTYNRSRHQFAGDSIKKGLNRLATYCRNNFSRFTFEIDSLEKSESTASLGKASEGDLTDAITRTGSSLIVLPNRRRNAFSRLFKPGITNHILFHSDTPMLVIPI